jgi:hypothetical protein
MTSKNWGIDTKASYFLFDLLKSLNEEKTITKQDIEGLAFFIGKVVVLEESFENHSQKG